MNWKKLSDQPLWEGFRTVRRWEFELPGGTVADFEIVTNGPAACVLALTPERRVILAKQFRPGPGKVLLELPGGGIDPGETPLQAAQRELLEETGYAGSFAEVGASWVSAYDTATRHAFIATDCVAVQRPADSPREPIEVTTCSLDEFRELLRSGELSDVASGYRCLDALGLLKD